MSDSAARDAGTPTEGARAPWLRRTLPALGAVVLFAAVSLVGTTLVYRDERVRCEDERQAALRSASAAAFSLQQQLDRALSATYALAAIVRQHGDVDDFDALAAEMLPLYGGLTTLQLAPGGVIRRSYPLQGNEAAIGHDLLSDPDRRFQALEAVRTRRLVVAGPFPLRQGGGLGLVGRLAVFVSTARATTPGSERFWGLVTSLVRVEPLIAASRLDALGPGGLAWALSRHDREAGRPQSIAGWGALARDPVVVSVVAPNDEWQLAVAPAAGWRAARWSMAAHGAAIALAALLAGLAYRVLRQPEILRREVEARTHDLARVNVQLAADVAERQQVEEALRRSERRFRSLIENSTDMIVVLDRSMRVAFWSPSATEQLGWTAEEAIGRNGCELVFPEDRPHSKKTLEALIASPGQTVRFERRQLHRDGSPRLVEVIARNLIEDPAVQGVVANLRDISEQRRLSEQFQQVQKLESVGRLAGGVAHDFNNLLTVILSCAEGLGQDLARGSPASAEDVKGIREAGERARDLTRQLLAFARRQVIAPTLLDLGEVARGAQKMMQRLLGEDIAVTVRSEVELWPVRCDRGQLEQVLLNLAANARDAMPRGGSLTIELRNLSLDAAQAALDPDSRVGDWVRLTVRDSGIGMSAEVKEHLFEPFFTTKPTGRGTGLGLATVYGIVEQSEGHISVRSEPGQGASFELHFPRAAGAAAAVAEPEPKRARGGTETILVLEDDASVLAVTAGALRAAGYRVLVARDGSEAFALTTREDGPLHLVISDVVLPGVDGRTATDELVRRRPGLRVLFVSGYTQDAISRHGVLDPGIEFLAKPFTPSDLLERVRRVLDA